MKLDLRTGLGVALALALAVVVTLPLWDGWWFNSHEMGRYPLRLYEFMRSWRDGYPIPVWAPDFGGGYGVPTFGFFAPGFLAVAGVPALFKLDVALCLKLATVAYGAAGTYGAFALVRAETKRLDAAVVAAFVFAFVPYRFVDLYARGDLAEYGALCLLPLALHLYRSLSRCSHRALPWRAFGAALVHAWLILTHTIIGQWSTELLAIVLLVTFRRERRLVAWLAFAGALALAAFYLVPALVEKSRVHMEIATQDYFVATKHLVPLADYFKLWYFDHVGDGLVGEAVRMPFSIGAPLVAALVAWVLLLVRSSSRAAASRATPWIAGVLGIMLLASTLAAPLWRFLPFGSYIQFPWRLLALIAALGTIAVGHVWAAAVPAVSRLRWPIALFVVAAIALDGSRFVATTDATWDVTPITRNLRSTSIRDHVETTSAGEHLPITAPLDAAPLEPRRSVIGEVVVGQATVQAEQRDALTYTIEIQAATPAIVDVNLMYYPGWRAEVTNGAPKVAVRAARDGRVRLDLPEPGTYTLTLAFRQTLVRRISALVSLAALLLLFPLLRAARRDRDTSVAIGRDERD